MVRQLATLDKLIAAWSVTSQPVVPDVLGVAQSQYCRVHYQGWSITRVTALITTLPDSPNRALEDCMRE